MKNESVAALIELFERDLSILAKEIQAYPSEELMWKVPPGISNSGGNLCMHLTGNLNHFIAKTIGGFDYERQRDFEFAGKNIPREKLLQDLAQCKNCVKESLENISEEQLNSDYPIRIFDREHRCIHFLMHLAGHLNYHLGQINYHRRLLSQ